MARKPLLIAIECPECGHSSKPIPADMGSKTIKCAVCGKYIYYSYSDGSVSIVPEPEREKISGRLIY